LEEQTTLEELEKEPVESVIKEEQEGKEESKEKGSEEQKEKPKENRYSKRVTELVAKYRQEEREKKELQKELEELREAKKLKKPPSPDDYEDGVVPEADQKKWDNQVREEIRKEEREKIKNESKAKKQREAFEKGKQNYIKSRSEYVKEYPDFHKYEVEIDEIVDQWQAPEIQDIILKSKNGLEIVKHFGKNPDDLLDIASSSLSDRIFKMGQLTAKLQAKTVKKTSSAPDPIRSEKGSAKTIPVGKDAPYNPKVESWADFTKRRNGL